MDSSGEEDSNSREPASKTKRKLKPVVQSGKRAKQNEVAGATRRKSDLYKPPTIEELNNLKVTENLFNNNLFRLQIEELIKEVAIKQKRRKALDGWLESLAVTLQQLPEHSVTLSNLRKAPYETDQDLEVILKKPDGFECFGLYDNGALPGPQLETSVNITMPKACFHVKDFLNNRYWAKRFQYLSYLGQHIKAHKKELVLADSNVLLPILLLQPTEDDKLAVKVYVTPPRGYFKPSRCLPNLNNVKKDLFQGAIQDVEVLKATPTALYNSALAHDVTLKDNFAFVKSILSEQTNVQEAIQLLLIWLKQRELDVGFGAFGGNLVLHLVAYLLLNKKINKLMSSYQVVKNFFAFISAGQWGESRPISLCDSSSEQLPVFQRHFRLVFLDMSGCHNLAAFLDLDVFRRVRAECTMALEHLNEGRLDSFQLLFLTKVPFALQHDIVLDLTEALPMTDQFRVEDAERATNIGFETFLPIKQLAEVLGKGLGKRALHIVPQIAVNWSDRVSKVLFGISLNAETAFNFIEMGPALSDVTQAEEFRQFWGYLASDRRFRDGSTHVAVYFKTSTMRGKRSIVKRIIKYLLNEKYQFKFRLYYDEFEEFIVNKMVTGPYPMGTNEEGSLRAQALADELGQKLRSVQMSLNITGIQAVSETFSYCSVFPPIASRCRPKGKRQRSKENNLLLDPNKGVPRYLEPVELVLQLEHSSKWPNNLQAIRHVKTSFYLELAKILQERHNVLSNVTKHYLELFYEGLVFRYRLHVPKELVMMKKQTTESGSTAYVDNADSREYEKMLAILPKVNASLKGIQMQFPSFGPATALIKRWLRCQMIDHAHLPDPVVNLLSVSLYLNATAFPHSSTPQVAFMRFLKFIGEFQWALQPLIVNFNDELTKEDVATLEEQFQQQRSLVQPLYVITPYDQGQSLFTTPACPSREVLRRVQQLAQASLKLIIDRISSRAVFELKGLFKPNTEGYDLLIHLKSSLNPRAHEQLDNAANCSRIVLKKYERREDEKIPVAGFNPVDLFLRSLRENYDDFAKFFHDSYGGSVIGVLWNPAVFEEKEFKVAQVPGRRWQGERLAFNKEALIDDFYILGQGLVDWIDSRRPLSNSKMAQTARPILAADGRPKRHC